MILKSSRNWCFYSIPIFHNGQSHLIFVILILIWNNFLLYWWYPAALVSLWSNLKVLTLSFRAWVSGSMSSWFWSLIFALLLFVNVNGQSYADESTLLGWLYNINRSWDKIFVSPTRFDWLSKGKNKLCWKIPGFQNFKPFAFSINNEFLERLELAGREPRIPERKRTRQNLDRVLKKPVFNFAYLFRQHPWISIISCKACKFSNKMMACFLLSFSNWKLNIIINANNSL